MKGTFRYLAGIAGPSGYGSNSTGEEVTRDCSFPVDAHMTAIITGATSGIGAETARVMAIRGVTVVIPARDMEKANHVKERIGRESPRSVVIVMELDLSSFASIKRFCSEFLSLQLPLNILVNNAGMFCRRLEFSEDKIEMTLATNFVGHVLLTDMLTEKMIDSAARTGVEGRIVNVSSGIYSWAKKSGVQLNRIDDQNNYNGTRAYAQSKLANILHVKGMTEELKARNGGVIVNAVNPGIVKTGIMREYKGVLTDSVFFIASKLLKSTSQAAATTCYVALHRDLEGVSGKYFVDCNEGICSAPVVDKSEAHELLRQARRIIQDRLDQM